MKIRLCVVIVVFPGGLYGLHREPPGEGWCLHVSQARFAVDALVTEHFTGWREKALGVPSPAETVTCESGQRSQCRTVLLELWCFVLGVFGPEQEGHMGTGGRKHERCAQ